MPQYHEPSPTMVQFIEAVNAYLNESGITKTELARRCGMNVATLRKILNANGGSCQFSTADRIAEALESTVIDLLNGEKVGR